MRLLAIFVMLAVAAFVFPGGVVTWLEERDRNGALDAPLAAMRGVDAASAAVGVKGAGQWVRKGFAGWVGE